MNTPRSLVFIGDSLTEYYDWQQRFPEHRVKNLGIAGEPAEGLLNRLNWELSRMQNPDVVFVMTGINNIAMDDYDIADTYREIVKRLSEWLKGSVIVVQSILPVLLPWIDNGVIKGINSDLKKIAEASGGVYLDVYQLFVDENGNPDASCLLDDGVHLSDRGYEVWSKAVDEFLSYS
ncbi:MAG: GDSL-type esterase/lipase family protein [Nitrospirota bacterium]